MTSDAVTSDDVLLSVRDLRTHFLADEGTTRAVDGISFDITAGRTLGMVGESGCGKSITARSVLGIVSPPGRVISGEILLRRDEGGSIASERSEPDQHRDRAAGVWTERAAEAVSEANRRAAQGGKTPG